MLIFVNFQILRVWAQHVWWILYTHGEIHLFWAFLNKLGN